MTSSLIARPEYNLLLHDHSEPGELVKDKKSIRKFMKHKKRKIKKDKMLERSQEIKRHIKVKDNLKVLNKYVRHIRAQSSGVYYNRNSGIYEQRKGFSNKLFKELEKSKTPKHGEFKGINFKKLLSKNNFTSDPNLRSGIKYKQNNIEHINVDTSSSQTNIFLEYFKILTGKNKKRSRSKQNRDSSTTKLDLEPNLTRPIGEVLKASMDRSQNNNSIKNVSNKKSKIHTTKPSNKYKRNEPKTRLDQEIDRNMNMMRTDENMGSMSDTMKKTLEENNKERDINLLTDNIDSERVKNMTFKYASAPVSNKNADGHDSIFSNSTKFAAFRASELKMRNKKFMQLYGNTRMLGNSRYEHELIKILHNAAMTIQDHWRDYILRKRSLNTEERNECMSSLKKLGRETDYTPPNNNNSSSQNEFSVPKLDLSQVVTKKEIGAPHDGIFSQESMLDLSAKRLQQLILSSDLPSMLKVREEGLNFKYTKEKKKIKKLLSSQKISPRTGNIREMELEKWVDQERKDIDRTKLIYEENRKITEENKKKIEEIISDTQLTQDQLKKIISDKVNTPRDNHSYRSGFNSSRRLYELSQINKQISSENIEGDEVDTRIKIDNDLSADSIVDNQYDNIVFSDHEESKDKSSLKDKIATKLKHKISQNTDISNEFDLMNHKTSIELIDVFKNAKFDSNKSQDRVLHSDSDIESPDGIIDTDNSKLHSRTPNIMEGIDDISPKSFKKNSGKKDGKEPSKSLEIGESFQNDNDGNNHDESNSNSMSLIRIKSEHNLKENRDQGTVIDIQPKPKKDKTYNSKNFFTENFDDQEMEDAINKIKSNPDFDKSSPENANSTPQHSNQHDEQNIELYNDEQTLSFDE